MRMWSLRIRNYLSRRLALDFEGGFAEFLNSFNTNLQVVHSPCVYQTDKITICLEVSYVNNINVSVVINLKLGITLINLSLLIKL